MRCPTCRCEVGHQSVCPYCGATVYVGNTTWNMNEYARNTTQYTQNRTTAQRESGKATDRKLRRLETKIDLLLVLQGGTFMLALLALIMIALK